MSFEGGYNWEVLVYNQEFLVFIVYKKKRTYLTASFHRFWLLPKAVPWKKPYDLGCTKKCPVKEFLYMNSYMNSYSHM